MKKRLEEYSLKDFWIRFLANYEEDKKSGMLEELCKLEESIKMAEATLFRENYYIGLDNKIYVALLFNMEVYYSK